MGKTSWTRDLGAVNASTAAAVGLRDRPDLPARARITQATVRNNSQAVLTVVNHPGQPQVDAGERADVDFDGQDGVREVQIQNDAVAVSSGEVKLTLTIEWGDA